MNNKNTSSTNETSKKEIKKQNKSVSRYSYLQLNNKKKKKKSKKKSSKEPPPIIKETKNEETQTEEKVTINVQTNTIEIERKNESINTELYTTEIATNTEPETVEIAVGTIPESAEVSTNTEPPPPLEIIQPIKKKRFKRAHTVPYNIYKHPEPFYLYINNNKFNTTPLATTTPPQTTTPTTKKAKTLTRMRKRKEKKYSNKLNDALDFSRMNNININDNNNNITSTRKEDDNIISTPVENNDSDDNADEITYTIIGIRQQI